MPQKPPDTLGFFRTELKKLERAPEPTMDAAAVEDLKRILVIRFAQLEGSAAPQPKVASESVNPDS